MTVHFKRQLKGDVVTLIDDQRQYVENMTLWENIGNKPELFPPKPHTHNVDDVVGINEKLSKVDDLKNQINVVLDNKVSKTDLKKLAYANTVSWNDITNKPNSFPPSPHKHILRDVGGTENLIDKNALLDIFGVSSISELKNAFHKIKQQSNSGRVGEEWHSMVGVVPINGIPYLGQTLKINEHKTLFDWAQSKGLVIDINKWNKLNRDQNGNVPYYGLVDNNQFRMPKFNSYPKLISEWGQERKWYDEGLPNITGWAQVGRSSGNYTQSGVFYNDGYFDCHFRHMWEGSSSSRWGTKLAFDASRASPIYGRSNNVTPLTATCLIGVFER